MLAGIILRRFGDAHGGKALVQHLAVIAAAAETIGPIDRLGGKSVHIGVGNSLHETREVARGTVALPAGVMTGLRLLRRLGSAAAFGKDAHMAVVQRARHAVAVADDVVVQIGLHPPALRLRMVGQHPAAEQALLLARQHGIDDGGREFQRRKNAGRFQHRADAGGTSLAPGASPLASSGSPLRLSIWAEITITRLGSLAPRCTASISITWVG